MQEIMKEMLLPVLLGDGIGLIRSIAAIGQSDGVVPLALTLHSHPFLPAIFPVRVRRLAKEELPFLCDLLASIAEAEEDRILCLVPCTPDFRRFVEENRRFLEEYYICAKTNDPMGIPFCRVPTGRRQE